MQYIGKALKEFRDSGKPVYAVGENYSQGQYYLASFANKIWLSPQGVVDLHGFATNGLYYKSLLDKLKFPPMCSAWVRINLPLNRLFVMICRRQPAKLTAAGLVSCGKTI